MRWVKGKDYVEIVSGISADTGGAIWYIDTNVNWGDLPIEFRAQIPKTDEEGYKKLEISVATWAERNRYHLVSSDKA